MQSASASDLLALAVAGVGVPPVGPGLALGLGLGIHARVEFRVDAGIGSSATLRIQPGVAASLRALFRRIGPYARVDLRGLTAARARDRAARGCSGRDTITQLRRMFGLLRAGGESDHRNGEHEFGECDPEPHRPEYVREARGLQVNLARHGEGGLVHSLATRYVHDGGEDQQSDAEQLRSREPP